MLRLQSAVKHETKRIALGSLVLVCIMLIVFLLVGRMDSAVLLGALLGYVCAVGNFFLMALSVQSAAESMNGVKREEEPEDEEASSEKLPDTPEIRRIKTRIRLSYVGRLFLIALTAIAAVKLPCFNYVSALVCLLFPRIVISVLSFIDARKG